MRITLLLFTLFAFSMPASAGMFSTIDERANQISTQLEGNNSYHAHLARELANIAVEEKGQHDVTAALEFIRMAESHADQAGGAE
ncbi:hypothetical protein [Mariprofundus sp. KV]|uniref:hypothetical protein n=1 Tax=Mariprofundus sp. KV TaxID=2608715 RepID=UPI0015A1AA05|nr:hypothetical protein [Mariprofundus sp. KV]NWF36323.1 hypothetical protein [Mariprofundus sp. KV]